MANKKKDFLVVGLFVLVLLNFSFGMFKWIQSSRNDYDSRLNETVLLSEKSLPESYNIVFYRRDCPFCKAGKKAVLEAAKETEIKTYFVNVVTSDGQKVVSEYAVSKAATIVAVRGQNRQSYIYAKTKDGKFRANQKKIEEAFHE
ncbi:MAG: thioredoxin [Streptococcus sp.]|uniref:thioredoxin n=1 Tax=Streptococcus sp. TaxID=1306 RepID=UPI00290FE0AE|nr:thioredoxin [Streptococcus sp.]MDU7740015.1 thioredoxin [Streptococcus sp.]